MSSPAPQTPTDDKAERRKSLGKYVKRLSSVLRRGSSSKSVPTASNTTEAAPSKPAAPAPAPTSAGLPEAEPMPSAETTTAGTTYVRSTIQQERARALFEKYGLTLEAHEWITTPAGAVHVQRVEKPIRMRVHRTCHRCQTPFGLDRICAKCEHKRCKKCPRYPMKKPKDATAGGKGKEAAGGGAGGGAGPIEVPKPRRKREPLLTIKSKTGGDLVYHPPKQRIFRFCHKCEAQFEPPTATECKNCKHIRCTKCPREPPKLQKWPHGYPGDASAETSDPEPRMRERTWKKARQKVRWSCDQCNSLFKEGSNTCPNCNHERCEKCTRKPPKKVKKEFDPDVVKAVEARLAQLSVKDQPLETAAAA